MPNKRFCGALSCLTAVLLLLQLMPGLAIPAFAGRSAGAMLDSILADQCGGPDQVQGWIDEVLCSKAGRSAEWYVLACAQSGTYSFSTYEAALTGYLDSHTVAAAASRQKYALTLAAIGSASRYITQTMEDSIGQQGVMSWIFGLHLLHNGYVSHQYTAADVTRKLLSLQLADGGWAVTGSVSDNDVTAMAVQALAPDYGSDSAVCGAVDTALGLLSGRQLEDGSFASYGVANAESTAQVITALSALGIDCAADERFQKNNCSPLDGLRLYQLSGGGFSHTLGGAANDTATSQAFYALVAYQRMSQGRPGLFLLDHCNPAGLESNPESPAVTTKPPTVSANSSDEPTAPGESPAVQTDVAESQQSMQTDVPDTTTESGTSDTTAATAGTSGSRLTETAAEATESGVAGETNATTQTKAEAEQEPATQSGDNRLWVCLGIVLLAGGFTVVLLIRKKRSGKNFAVLWGAAGVGILLVLTIHIQSAETYYNSQAAEKQDVVGTVTLTIRCDTVAGQGDPNYIPADGCVLAETEFELVQGETVYDILVEAARTYGLQVDNSGGETTAYIAGIQYLYELDFGDLSGWVYHVNGAEPSVGCDQYTLSDGDEIAWLYTCALGKDLAESGKEKTQ